MCCTGLCRSMGDRNSGDCARWPFNGVDLRPHMPAEVSGAPARWGAWGAVSRRRAGLRRAHFWKSSIVIIVSSSAFTVLMMSGVEMRPPFTGLRERSMRIFFCIASPTWIFFCIMSSFLWRLSARSIDCMKSGPRADPTLLGLRVDIMPGGWRWKSSPGLLDFCLMSTRPEPFTSVGPGRRRRSGGPRQGKASVFWAGHRGCALLTEASKSTPGRREHNRTAPNRSPHGMRRRARRMTIGTEVTGS